MKNLREESGGRRVAVGAPLEMTEYGVATDGKLLFGGYRENPGGTVAVFSSGSDIVRVTHIRPDGSRAVQRLSHGGAPAAVTGIAGGIAVTGPGARPMLLRLDSTTERYTPTDFSVTRPPFSFAAEPMEVLTASAATLRLADTYSDRDTSLSEADARTAGKQMTQLYTDIADRAAAAGRFIQPVLACYRLKGHDGRTLYTSAPVIAGLPEGVQATASSTARIASGSNTATGLTLTARAFRLSLVKSDSFESGLAEATAEVEVLLAPPIHPLEPGATCDTLLTRAATNTLSLTLWLPGTGRNSAVAAPGSRMHTAIGLMLTRRGALSMTAAGRCRLDAAETLHPFDTLRNTYVLQAKRLATVLAAAERHLAALAASPSKAEAERRLSRLSAPHAFGAVCGATSGETLVWGGLRRIRFEGYSPVEMAVESREATGAPTYEAAVEGRGFGCIKTVSGTERQLSAFSPLLCYPDGEAMALTLTAGGLGKRFELTPTPDGSMSYYLAPDLAPVATSGFAAVAEVPTTSDAEPEEDDSLAGLAETGDPTRLLAVIPTSAGAIAAVAAAPRASGSLEFGRNVFYVFGRDGIDMVRVNAGRGALTAMRLDARGVDHSSKVAVSATAVSALAGGDLITFSSSHKPLTIARRLEADMLGFEESRGEYWCFRDDTDTLQTADLPVIGGGPDLGDISDPLIEPEKQPPLRVIGRGGADSYYRDDLTVGSMLTTAQGLIVADGAGRLLDASCETVARKPVEVEYETTVELAAACRPRLMRLDTGLTGREVDATVKVTPLPSATAVPDSRNALSVKVSGDISHPYCLPVATPHAHALRIEIKATGRGIEIAKKE